MRLTRLAAAAAALVAVLLGLTACGGSGKKSTVAKDCTPKYHVRTHSAGTLTVAAIQYPPYSKVTPGSNDVQGIDGAIVKQFARDACLNMKVTTTTFAAAVSSVTTGRADIALGDIYRTTARAQEVGLSDPVYLDQLGIVSKQGFGSMQSLLGHKVATVQGYYFENDVKRLYGGNLHLFPSNVNMYQDLVAGRSQAGLDSYPAAVDYLRSRGITNLKVEIPPADPRVPATGAQAAQSGFLYGKGATQLATGLNQFLAAIRQDGTLADLLQAAGLPRSAANVGPARLL